MLLDVCPDYSERELLPLLSAPRYLHAPRMTLGVPDRRRGTTRQNTASHGHAVLRRLSTIAVFAAGKVRIPDKIQSLVGKKVTLPEHFRISEFRDARGFASIKPLQQVNDTDVSTSWCVARRRRAEHFLLCQEYSCRSGVGGRFILSAE
jgi:hypothetical protein